MLERRAVRTRIRSTARLAGLSLCLALSVAPPAAANNYGESLAWQFQTPGELAAQAATRDLIERRRGGAFAAPVYNTQIQRQYNCSVSASATGNSGVQSALANSPTVTGATATATGNSNATTIAADDTDAQTGNGQLNTGAVTSGVIGSTSAQVRGVAWQALHSDQRNSGDQRATVNGSNACAFGVLN